MDNCFDKLKGMRKIAYSIVKEYQILKKLEKENKKNSEEYTSHFLKLKEMVALEKMYYSFLDVEDIDFIFKYFERDNNFVSYTIVDIPFFIFKLDEKVNLRVYRNLCLELDRRTIPNWNGKIIQSGMIPLFPASYDHYDKIYMIGELFNTELSDLLLNNKAYSKDLKLDFKYCSSNMDVFIENYYLQTMFEFKEDALFASRSITEAFKEDNDVISCINTEYFSYLFLDFLQNISEISDQELLFDTYKEMALSINIDILCAIINVVPIISIEDLLSYMDSVDLSSLKNSLLRVLLDNEMSKALSKRLKIDIPLF